MSADRSTLCAVCGSYWGCEHIAPVARGLHAINDAIDIIAPPAVIQRCSWQPEADMEPDTLYQHLRRIDAEMREHGRPLRSMHISAAGLAEIEYGQHGRRVALLLPAGVDHRDWIDRQIRDVHDSGIVGPLCATYDEYESLVGDQHGSFYVWPYRCQLPGCQIPLDTAGQPMGPLGSRFDNRNTSVVDAHALAMGWVKRLPNGQLVCAGHPR